MTTATTTYVTAAVKKESDARQAAVNDLDRRLDIVEAWIAAHPNTPLPVPLSVGATPGDKTVRLGWS